MREKATGLSPMQATHVYKFNFRPHCWPREDREPEVKNGQGNVEEPLGTSGDNLPKGQLIALLYGGWQTAG